MKQVYNNLLLVVFVLLMAASGWKIAAEVKSLIELSDETTNSSKNSSTHVFPFPSDDNSTKHGTTALYGTSVRYVAPADRVARCQSQALPKLPVGILSGGKDATTRRKNIRETWATTSQCIFFIVGKSADEGMQGEAEGWGDMHRNTVMQYSSASFNTSMYIFFPPPHFLF